MSSAPLGLAEREAQLTVTLATMQEQRWAQSEASFERSEVRSARGDRMGALEDAKVALALFPSHTKYLIRASHAFFESGTSDEAARLLERAKGIANSQGNDDKAISAALAVLDRRLRPFEYLPTEVIANIFAFVHQDFERMPSPYQLTQVSRRWQEIAESTGGLWRDTRILRVRDKATTSDCDFSPAVRKAYRWSQTECPSGYVCTRADADKVAQLRGCANLSHNSLSHFELEVHDWEEGYEGFLRIFEVIELSMPTLESLAFIHASTSQRQRFSRPQRSSRCDFAAVSLAFVLRCPKAVDIRVSVGELTSVDIDDSYWTFAKKQISPTDAFRQLQLDSFGGLTSRKELQVRAHLLQRSSQLRNLTLGNIPRVEMSSFTKSSTPLALELLAACASTLMELDLSGKANPLVGARAIGTTSFPELRRVRFVADSLSKATARGDMEDIAFPKLESIEAPLDFIVALGSVPPRITLRLNEWSTLSADCAGFAEWLRCLEDDQSLQTISVLVTSEPEQLSDRFLDSIIAALTPRHGEKVTCPNLVELKVLHRAGYLFDSMGLCHSLDPAPLPEPIATTYVPKLLAMGEQRRRVSQEEPNPTVPTSASSREASAKRQKLSTAAKAVSGCQALRRVVIEGARISADDWAAMKASPCHYEVTPSPHELAHHGP